MFLFLLLLLLLLFTFNDCTQGWFCRWRNGSTLRFYTLRQSAFTKRDGRGCGMDIYLFGS